MHGLWHWLLYVLTWSSADPGVIDAERARTAGSVNVAYAGLALEPTPAPKPQDVPAAIEPPKPCQQCSGTGRIYRPDGGWVKCSCGACSADRCQAKGKATR
jgi:hypothetical protein